MAATRAVFRDEILTDRQRKNLAMLDVIRRLGPVAKTEISKLTGFNIVTVSNYVDEYLERGLVLEKGYDVSTGGRRPILVELNTGAGYLIGVGLTMFHIAAVLTNIKGEVQNELKYDRPAEAGEVVVQSIVKIVDDIIKLSKKDPKEILGIGLGMPGVIDDASRTMRWPGALGTRDAIVNVSLKELFEEKYEIPTLVENDADAAVFGEKWYSLRQDVRNMLYMYSGVSCGIIINGQIYHGTTGSAGELGVFNPMDGDVKVWKEESRKLGRWEMDLGMVEEAKAKGSKEKVTVKAIFDAAKEGDSLAREVVEQAGARLGKKIAFLVNLLNPEIVVIGGGIEQAGYALLDSIKRAVKAWAIDEATAGLKIIPAELGESAVSLGAAGLALSAVYARGMGNIRELAKANSPNR